MAGSLELRIVSIAVALASLGVGVLSVPYGETWRMGVGLSGMGMKEREKILRCGVQKEKGPLNRGPALVVEIFPLFFVGRVRTAKKLSPLCGIT